MRKYLEELGLDEAARAKWLAHWIDTASHAVETTLARDPRTGRFCCGDTPTIADICVFAHLTSAKLFGGREASHYPVMSRIFTACQTVEAFTAEHPSKQPDAPSS